LKFAEPEPEGLPANLIDDERRKNLAGLLMSLIMLLETQGGFGRGNKVNHYRFT